MVNRGEITSEQARDHPSSNVLMGCLGTERDPPMDTHHIDQLDVGDALLACSDARTRWLRRWPEYHRH